MTSRFYAAAVKSLNTKRVVLGAKKHWSARQPKAQFKPVISAQEKSRPTIVDPQEFGVPIFLHRKISVK